MNRLMYHCPRCGAKVGEQCHDASGYGAPHPERGTGVLILLSGGMDSSLLLKRAHKAKRRIVPLFVDYGQPHHDAEKGAALGLCHAMGLHLREVDVGLFGGLSRGGSPVVPGRNLALIAIAANRAVAEGCSEVQIGCCAVDAVTFKDCTPQFIKHAAAACAAAHITLAAPLLHTTKREIRDELGRMFAQTWSCYHPNDGNACGQCGACKARGIL